MLTRDAASALAVSGDQDVRLKRAYHELKSPTALIATVARAALEEHDLTRAYSALELIERIAGRTLNRVSTVLDPATSAARPRPADFLEELAADSLRCGLDVELTVDPAAAALQVTHDPAAFETLAQSLIENAGAHGDPATPIRVCLERVTAGLRFDVSNRIAAVDRHAGQRLGLALADDLARRMRGDLWSDVHDDIYHIQVLIPAA